MKLFLMLCIFVFSMIISCTKSPSERLCGTWQYVNSNYQMAILNNGTYFTHKGMFTWNVSDSRPFTFTYNDTSKAYAIKFSGNDTLYFDDFKYVKVKYLENIQEYFPMTPKSRWEYDIVLEASSKKESFSAVYRVTDTYSIGKEKIYRVAHIWDPPDSGNEEEFLRIDETGVYLQSQTDTLESQNAKFAFPLVINRKWNVIEGQSKGTCKFNNATDLDLREASFKDVLVFHKELVDERGYNMLVNEYYARGVGLVKASYDYEGLITIEMVLKDFSI